MSSPEVPVPKKKLPLLKLAVLAVVLGAVAVAALVMSGVDVKAWFAQGKSAYLAGLAALQAAGPWAYFTAMAVLPGVGFPLLAFTLTVGPTFGAQLGLGGVIAASAASIGINLAVTYWLARRLLRPWLEKLIVRFGHKIPVVEAADQFEITLLLRITPGPPFFLQNYLLGLAKIPFRLYFLLSWAVLMLQTTGLIIFGKSLAEGKGKQAVMGVSVFIAVMLGVHLVRRHYGKRKP